MQTPKTTYQQAVNAALAAQQQREEARMFLRNYRAALAHAKRLEAIAESYKPV